MLAENKLIQLPINFSINKLPRNLSVNQKFKINNTIYILQEIETNLHVYNTATKTQDQIKKYYTIREYIE